MNDAFGFPQSVVLLGGSSDIGRAILRHLGARRCETAVLAGRNPALLDEAMQEAKAAGFRTVRSVPLEATDVVHASDVVDATFGAAGEVDLVVMAVGLLGEQERDEQAPARVAEVVTVNYTWPAAALTRATALLRAQGKGRVVVLSTVAGIRVRRANYVYGSAKAGLDAFCIGLAEACRGSGITVQLVRPGFVRSKMTRGRPEAPLATTPDAVATAVMRALTSGEPIVWVPPTLRWAFLALRNLPQGLWRRLPG